jgi:transposase
MVEIQQIVASYNRCGSYSQVAREFHISRNTVKKYVLRVNEVRSGLRDEILPSNREIIQPPRVVTDEILLLIHTLLEQNLIRPRKQRMNARQIFDQVTQTGYSISYATIKRLISSWNKSHSSREVYILQEPEPGYRAEFDWCEVSLQIKGVWTKVSMAVMVLTYSLFRFARLYYHETQQEVIDAHIQFFSEIQSVPRYIYYDNLRAVYDYSRKKFQDTYLQFASHYGYSYAVCNPASPHEKGTDEESVSYIRRNAFGERTSFESIQEAQEWLITSLERLNCKNVYRREKTPMEALKDEQKSMFSLPSLEYSNVMTKLSRISKYSFVSFDRNYYSVPDTYRQKHIMLKISQERIDLLSGPELIASHQRLYGKGQYSLNICHFLKTFGRKPGALEHSKVIQQVPPVLLNLFESSYREKPLEFIHILNLTAISTVPQLISAIEKLQKNHILPGYDTIRMILNNTPSPVTESLERFDMIDVPEPDLTVYDQVMECTA